MVLPTTLDPLVGRTALVTGAGNGLGLAIAIELSAAGVRVILAGRDAGKLRRAREGLRGEARVVQIDVSSAASVSTAAEQLHDEAVSILINNAGIAGPVATMTDIAPEDWDEVFAINVRGVYLMCRAFIPPMMSRGKGDVINIASVTGKRPLARRTPYAASKMAVIGLTATLAHEVGTTGVRVNSLSPGPVAGPRMKRNFALEAKRIGTSPQEAEAEFVARGAIGRMVTEAEVAAATIAMLEMPGLCGADLDLSGGMVAR